jgi:hypothetical protein
MHRRATEVKHRPAIEVDLKPVPLYSRAYVPSPLRERVRVWVKSLIDTDRQIQRVTHPPAPSLKSKIRRGGGGGTDAASTGTRETQV